MIHISKNKEPMIYTKYCSNDDASFANIDTEAKIALKKSLLEDQGYICAYCMSVINLDNMKVEHYVPRERIKELSNVKPRRLRSEMDDLVYSNLLAVCKGNQGKNESEQTCDTRKANKQLTIDPQNPRHMQTIEYKRNGTILSTNTDFDSEINEVLNLNNFPYGHLINERQRTLDAFKAKLSKEYKGTIQKTTLSRLLNYYINKKNSGKYPPYVGIIIWYLQDKIS